MILEKITKFWEKHKGTIRKKFYFRGGEQGLNVATGLTTCGSIRENKVVSI